MSVWILRTRRRQQLHGMPSRELVCESSGAARAMSARDSIRTGAVGVRRLRGRACVRDWRVKLHSVPERHVHAEQHGVRAMSGGQLLRERLAAGGMPDGHVLPWLAILMYTMCSWGVHEHIFVDGLHAM